MISYPEKKERRFAPNYLTINTKKGINYFSYQE